MAQNTGKIILDNAGGITLQLGDWACFFAGNEVELAAKTLSDWLEGGDPEEYDGHDDDAAELVPTAEQIANGGYKVIDMDRDSDETNHYTIRAALRQWEYGNAAHDLAIALFETAD